MNPPAEISANCSVCKFPINSTSPGLPCSGKCKEWFHIRYVNLPQTFEENAAFLGFSWHCFNCHREIAEENNFPTIPNVDELLLQFNLFNRKQEALLKSMKFCIDSVDNINEKLVDICVAPRKIFILKNIIKHLENENVQLKIDIEQINEISRMNNIEINGVPGKPNENIVELVKKVGKFVGIEIPDITIDACYRACPMKKSSTPKSIIVRFNSRILKENIFCTIKRRKDALNASVLDFDGDFSPIYVSIHLTPAKKHLLFETKKICPEIILSTCGYITKY